MSYHLITSLAFVCLIVKEIYIRALNVIDHVIMVTDLEKPSFSVVILKVCWAALNLGAKYTP